MIYLDNAATSFPKPDCVYARMDEYARNEAANPGRSGHKMSVNAEAQIVQARSLLAQLFHVAEPERIVFTLNCTDSLNIAMKGVLQAGDHVVTTMLEHNSVLRPLNQLEASGVIQLTKLKPSHEGVVTASQIKEAIQPDTKLIAMTHASNVIGTVLAIGGIGKMIRQISDSREKPILFLVDAAQTAGVIPIDVETDAIDLLAFPGHKALYGPPGTGGLWVGKRAQLSPWREGGTGFDSESAIHPDTFPFALEGGTPNSVGIVGLKEGVQFILDEGIDKIRQHEQTLISKLKEGLSHVPDIELFGSSEVTRSVAPVSFRLGGVDPQEVSLILDESFEIASRAGLHCAPLTHQALNTFPQGTIRLSPGYFNTIQDIETAVAAVSEIQKQMAKVN